MFTAVARHTSQVACEEDPSDLYDHERLQALRQTSLYEQGQGDIRKGQAEEGLREESGVAETSQMDGATLEIAAEDT